MTTWADIQRLASDLQRVQLSQSAKKLSDSNCIEVVSKLIQKSLIDVVFTRDGRSYVTNKYLATEVRNECLGLGGRASLTDMATSLNLDFDHVDRTVRMLVAEDEDYVLSNGELFAQEYVTSLQSDLRSLLAETGSRSTAYLGKYWNLSQELLQSLLLSKLSEVDGVVLDGDTIYTLEYLEQHTNILKAVLVAITKTTSISSIQSRVGLPPARFWAAFDELLEAKEISGRLSGSRTSPSCSFVPALYDTLVQKCAQNSYRQNEYIATSIIKKLGLVESKAAVSQLLGEKQLECLPTLFISTSLYEQCTTTVREAVTKDGVCEVQSTMQSLDVPFDIADIDTMCEQLVKKDKNLLTSEGFVYSCDLLTKAFNSLDQKIEERAHSELDRMDKEKKQQPKPAAAAPKKNDDDDDWGDNKKGGKKKGGGGRGAKGGKGKAAEADEEDQNQRGSSGIGTEELEQWIKECSSVPEEIVEVVGEKLSAQANDKLRRRVAELAVSQQSANAQSQKKQLVALEAKARSLYHSICTFEDATSSFSTSLSADLSAHIVRSVGGELAAVVLAHASGTENAGLLSEKQRDETISSLPPGPRDSVFALYESVKSGDFETFHTAVEGVAARAGCGLQQLRRPDEKTMSAWTASYISELSDSVSSQSDAASCLLSAILLLLARAGQPTTATGKFVARLVSELEQNLPASSYELLVSCQRGVVQCIKNKEDDVAKEMLSEDIEKLKKMVVESQ